MHSVERAELSCAGCGRPSRLPSVRQSLTVLGQVLVGHGIWRHQSIVFLGSHSNVVPILLELEECDQVIPYELRSKRSTDERWELLPTNGDVLFDLDSADLVASALGLDGYYVVRAALVHPDVDLIRLYLADACGCRSEVVLERIACDAEEDIDESIVADAGENGLLVAERILGNYSWGRIRHLRDRKVWVGRQWSVADQDEPVHPSSRGADDPSFSIGRFVEDAGGKFRSVPEAVDQVAQVLGYVDAQFGGSGGDVLPREGYLSLSTLVLGYENRLDDP